MIGWQHLAAFWALPLLAVPVIVHLLRVHRADRVLFPSLRFVQLSRTAAVRPRTPSDLLLLALRMSIVAMAIAALAGPVLVTPARVRSWNGDIARAVILDTSASMHVAESATAAAQAKDAAGAEARTATYARVFEAQDLGISIARAAAWLGTTPPARREIVVLSDFQRGAIAQETIAGVPASIGMKLVSIGRPSAHHTLAGVDTVGAPGVAPRRQTIELTAESTAVAFAAIDHPVATGHDGALTTSPGLRFVNGPPAEQTTLLRALAKAGTPAGSPDQPIAFVFDADKNASALEGLAPIRERWMLRTVLRLKETPSMASHVRAGAMGWGGVRLGSDPKELVIGVAAPASAFAAAAVVRATLTARRSIDDYAEQEIARTSDAALAAWNRQAGPVDREAWRTVQSTDARWCWLVVLALLGVEQWLRAKVAVGRSQEVTRAAA